MDFMSVHQMWMLKKTQLCWVESSRSETTFLQNSEDISNWILNPNFAIEKSQITLISYPLNVICFSYLGIYWFFSVPMFWKFKVKFLGVGLLSSIVLSILSIWKLTSFSSENFYWTISLMISSLPFFLLSFSVLLLFG